MDLAISYKNIEYLSDYKSMYDSKPFCREINIFLTWQLISFYLYLLLYQYPVEVLKRILD